MASSTMNGSACLCSKAFPDYALSTSRGTLSGGQNVCLRAKNSNESAQQWIFHSQGNLIYKLATRYTPVLVLDHYRVTPLHNCDIYTSGSSEKDLADQRLLFEKEANTVNEYKIRLYGSPLYLTCSSTADGKGCEKPTTNQGLEQKNNVYWGEQLEVGERNRQAWLIEPIFPLFGSRLLENAPLYCQRDPTWAPLTIAREFDSLACGITACASVAAMMEQNNTITPATMQTRGVFRYGNVSPNFDRVSTQFICNPPTRFSDLGEYCRKILFELMANRPVFIRVQKPTFQHWVVAYGSASDASPLNTNSANLYILDSYNPEYTRLSDLLKGSKMLFIKTVTPV